MDGRQQMLAEYDRDMLGELASSYFGDSGFYNYGYWSTSTRNQREASANLVEKLLSMLPSGEGRVLDAACGVGGSTQAIDRLIESGSVCAINISEPQIRQTRRRAPDSRNALMDAARLGFAAESFDAVVCVEAAFHFDTREAFFREAYRVLKPGGTLVMSDILYRRMPRRLAERAHLPAANRISGLKEYRRALSAVGFTGIEVSDATRYCSASFSRNLLLWPFRTLLAESASMGSFLPRLSLALRQGCFAMLAKHYLLVSACKA